MAWAKKLPSGKYQAKFRDRTGTERSAGTYNHKRQADKEASAAEVAARKLGWRDPSAAERTWGEWCEQWWPTRGVEPSTAGRDESVRKVHLIPKWASVPLYEITRQDVRAWITELGAGKLAAASVIRIVNVFSVSLSAAVDAEIIPANPAYRIPLPQRTEGQERYLTHAEYTALDAQLPTPQDQAIAALLVGSGLRWGEALGLHRTRTDQSRSMLRVVEAWDPKSRTMKPYPKGRRLRDVPLMDWVSEKIDALDIPNTRECGFEHREGRCRSNLLLHPLGVITDLDNWRKRVWTPAVKSAGLDHVRPHDLRHTTASWLIQDGISLEEVGRILGHVSPATTRRYAHLAEMPLEHIRAALADPFRAANVPQTDASPGYTGLRLIHGGKGQSA